MLVTPSPVEDVEDERWRESGNAPLELEIEAEVVKSGEEYPALDVQGIVVQEGATDVDVTRNVERRDWSSGSSLGPAGIGPDQVSEAAARAIGRRGEEAVYMRERRRLSEENLDPGQVRWVSDEHPFAAYDIQSLDEGQRIYIEVKATKGSDPYAPFEISDGELVLSLQKQGRYLVYRVTEAHTATPTITRFRDPIELLRSGSARMRISSARMSFVAGSEQET